MTPGTRTYVYQPSDPTPSIGGNGIGFLDAGGRPQERLERRDGKDLLVYTSSVLEVGRSVSRPLGRSRGGRERGLAGLICDLSEEVCRVLPQACVPPL